MVRDLLVGKLAGEKAVIKGREIAKFNHVGIFISQEYGVKTEILSLAEIPGGVEILAKAWKNGKPLGFGKDGTIEIERFRIINPPILVPDPNGFVVAEHIDKFTGKLEQRKVREDPVEAIRQSLAHTIKVVGKENTPIIRGSFGNTTSTFYAHSSDGNCYDNSSSTWSTVRGATSSNNAPETSYIYFGTDKYPTPYGCSRSFLTFLTGDDIPTGSTIDSATISLYGYPTVHVVSNWTVTANSVCLQESLQASATSLASGDYDALTLNTPTEFITRVLFSNLTNSAYNDFALNSNGLANIIMGAGNYSKFVFRASGDVDNVQPGAATCYSNAQFQSSETADTTQDPKLVVVHVAAYQPRHGFVFHQNPGIV